MRCRHNTTPCCASQHLFDVFTSERFINKMLFYGNTQRVHIISIYFNKFLPLFSKLTHAFFIVGTSYALRRVGVLLKYSYEVFLYELNFTKIFYEGYVPIADNLRMYYGGRFAPATSSCSKEF